MSRIVLLGMHTAGRGRSSQSIVRGEDDPADGEGEEQALEIEARAPGQVEQGRWVPVRRDEEGLGQTQGHRPEADPKDLPAKVRPQAVEDEPRDEEARAQ
jgi:hypothetical protein